MTLSSSAVSRSTLPKLLTSPSKLAHAIDWHQFAGSVLTLNILRDRIELAVAPHPSQSDEPVQSLPSIPVKTSSVNNQRTLSPSVSQELKSLLDSWRVCGLVVNWPAQRDGWCGAPCGRVLFTLDQLAKDIDRPICLWDHAHAHVDDDEWGRNRVYARRTVSKEVHVASEEQYKAPNVALVDIWNDFCRSHWPELYYNVPGVAASSSSARGKSTSDSQWLESATH